MDVPSVSAPERPVATKTTADMEEYVLAGHIWTRKLSGYYRDYFELDLSLQRRGKRDKYSIFEARMQGKLLEGHPVRWRVIRDMGKDVRLSYSSGAESFEVAARNAIAFEFLVRDAAKKKWYCTEMGDDSESWEAILGKAHTCKIRYSAQHSPDRRIRTMTWTIEDRKNHWSADHRQEEDDGQPMSFEDAAAICVKLPTYLKKAGQSRRK